MTIKHIYIPRLRFIDFTGGWGKTKLANITSKISDGLHSTPNYDENGEYYFINGNNLICDRIYFAESTKKVNNEEFKRHKKELSDRTILISINGTIGSLALYNDEKVILGKSACYLNINEDVDKLFVYNSLKTASIRNFFNAELTGSTIRNLSLTTIKNCEIHIPTLPEQQKIASFLSSIDEKIQQLTRKKELLEQYKKGVMQQLFSGKLRFKSENGKAYPKWEEKLYEDIFSFYTTNSFSRDNLNYESGKVKNIHYGDIHTKFSSRFEVLEEVVPYVNPNVDLSKLKDENYCQEGDLVIADASEDYADIGKSIELIKLNNEKVVAGLHTFLARPNKTKMYIGFSGYLVQAPYVRKQVMTIAQGTKVLSLSPGRLGKVKLEIPCVEEQQKIANYLSAIDSKIEIVANQITKTQTFKKGLLQGMFV